VRETVFCRIRCRQLTGLPAEGVLKAIICHGSRYMRIRDVLEH
jgi:hypothetical protein